MRGKIKFTNPKKQYGFITPEDRRFGVGIFFNSGSLVKDLNFDNLHEGVEVRFDITQSVRGPTAYNRPRVYQLIDAVKINQNLCTMVHKNLSTIVDKPIGSDGNTNRGPTKDDLRGRH